MTHQITVEDRLNALLQRCEVMPDIDIPTGSIEYTVEESLKEIDSLREKLQIAETALYDLRTGIYHTSRVTHLAEEALSKIRGGE